MEETTPVPPQSSTKILSIVGIIIVIGIVGYSIVNKPQTQSTPTTTSPITDETGVTTINLEAGSFYYSPNEIRVKKGEKVKIVMTSKDMMHDFNIDELSVKLPITKSGETNSVEFTPDKTGTFEYYCSVGQHRAHGQVGKIIVE